MKILVLGVTGMLGSTMFRVLSGDGKAIVYGTARNNNAGAFFSNDLSRRIISNTDVENSDSLVGAFAAVKPDVVVNCIGLVKQLTDANDPLKAIPINTMLPHRLASLCQATGARLVHISTDCVFSGAKGNYLETDFPDAHDLYGRSKFLGEVDYPHAVTLRTSIIGHELSGNRSLVNWFLDQKGTVNGFTHAVFSGLPTVELATLVRDYVIPREELHGLYHVSADPINKFALLNLISEVYTKNIEIRPSDNVVIDRSLNSDRFMRATGYKSAEWRTLIRRMFEFR